MDNSYCFVSNDQSRAHRVLAFHNVQVCAADGSQCNSYYGFPIFRMWNGNILNPDLARSAKHQGLHGGGFAFNGRASDIRYKFSGGHGKPPFNSTFQTSHVSPDETVMAVTDTFMSM